MSHQIFDVKQEWINRHKNQKETTATKQAQLQEYVKSLIHPEIQCRCNISLDTADNFEEIRFELKSALLKELEVTKSGFYPSSASKIYAWKSYLKEDNKPRMVSDEVPSRTPSSLRHLSSSHDYLIKIYQRPRNHEYVDNDLELGNKYKLKKEDGYYKMSNRTYLNLYNFKDSPPLTEDECKDIIMNEKRLDSNDEKRDLTYSRNWAFEDQRTGPSFKEFITKD